MMTNPYKQYKEQSLSTLSSGELLVKLFDELVKQMRLSILWMEKKDYAQVNEALNKSQTILATLESSLDNQYEISNNLRALYIFMAKQLMTANIKKNPDLVEECIPLARDLRESFDQAEKLSRKTQRVAVGGQAI